MHDLLIGASDVEVPAIVSGSIEESDMDAVKSHSHDGELLDSVGIGCVSVLGVMEAAVDGEGGGGGVGSS